MARSNNMCLRTGKVNSCDQSDDNDNLAVSHILSVGAVVLRLRYH